MPEPCRRGLHKTTSRLASGEVRVYWYAWKGGPKLPGDPGSKPFEVAYDAAVKQRRQGKDLETLAGVAALYRQSPEFAALAESTRAERVRYLDIIRDLNAPREIGSLPVATLSDFRVKQHLLAWRDQWKRTPRKADYSFQVLSAVLSWAAGRGLIQTNVLIGHTTLYKSNRASLVWTPDEENRFVAVAPSPEVGFIIRLACLTGLRRADLLRLQWSDISDVAIVIQPEKSQNRRVPKKVTIPLLDETLLLLSEIRAQQVRRWQEVAEAAAKRGKIAPSRPLTVLTSTRALPWSKNGAEHQVIDTKKKAGIDKHLHDCRGTFATRLRLDGVSHSEIADILGWTENQVDRLMKLYVDTDVVVLDVAKRLRQRSATRHQR